MSVLVSVVDPEPPRSLLQRQLRLEARVGIEPTLTAIARGIRFPEEKVHLWTLTDLSDVLQFATWRQYTSEMEASSGWPDSGLQRRETSMWSPVR